MSIYTRQQWQNDTTSAPYGPISGARLSNIEAALDAATLSYNVKADAYGATGLGVADDSAAMNAALSACISAGGGTIDAPGTYKLISAPLDFSALKGTNSSVRFRGAGFGNYFSGLTGTAPTKIINATGGPAFKAYGDDTGPGHPIFGVGISGMLIQNTVALGSNYTIDFDYVWSQWLIEDVFVDLNGLSGHGIRILNNPHGQGEINRTTVRNGDASSVGFEVSNYPSANVVGNPGTGGNCTLNACAALNVFEGYRIGYDPGTAVSDIDGVVLHACKSGGNPVSTDPANATGLRFGTKAKNCVATGHHSERFDFGYRLEGQSCTLISPTGTFGVASPAPPSGASSAAVRVAGTGIGNVVQALRVGYMGYGALLDSGATGNRIDGRDIAGQLVINTPTFFQDNSLGANFLSYTAPAVPTYSFGKADVSANRFRETIQTLTTSGGATVTIDPSLGGIVELTVTDGTAFTIANAGPSANLKVGHRIVLSVINGSGTTLGVITWGAGWKKTAFTNPANTKRVTGTFVRESTNTFFVQTAPWTGDV